MTSNKSSAIQFKIYKEVYDSVAREFRVEPIRMGPNDYAEVKLVVSHEDASGGFLPSASGAAEG